jgi:hypothetical protein
MHLVPLFIIPLIIVRLLKTFVRDEHAFTHAEQEQIKGDLAAIKRALGIDHLPPSPSDTPVLPADNTDRRL